LTIQLWQAWVARTAELPAVPASERSARLGSERWQRLRVRFCCFHPSHGRFGAQCDAPGTPTRLTKLLGCADLSLLPWRNLKPRLEVSIPESLLIASAPASCVGHRRGALEIHSVPLDLLQRSHWGTQQPVLPAACADRY